MKDLGLLALALLLIGGPWTCSAIGAQQPKAHTPKGDWPMTRGGAWRANRATVAGNIRSEPQVAWRYAIDSNPGAAFSADLDEDGVKETYSAENFRLVRRDAQGKEVWESAPITRGSTLIAFDDLDGDGKREPLMLGTGLNRFAPLYFVFDPKTGAIRWKAELAPTNGGDTRFGKIDPSRKGLQLLRALFPNPGGGEAHLFCWDQGIEQGYSPWSWQRHSDFIYFPQLAVGDVNHDGQNEILMLSQMCIWLFDTQLGSEITRLSWGRRSRSYGGQFGLWQMKPGDAPSIVVASAYNKVTVVDVEVGPPEGGPTSSLGTNAYRPPRNVRLTLRWDHEFEPGVADENLKGGYGTGNPGFLPDSVCDLDGDGWAEIVVSESAAYADERWRVVVLAARDGQAISEIPGKIIVGAADVDGDGSAEVFLRNRVEKHDPITGPVQVARWRDGKGLEIVWSAPEAGELVREPNDPSLHLSRHPDEGTRIKLAPGSRAGSRTFFIRTADGKTQAYEADGPGFRRVAVEPPADRVLPLAGLGATQGQPMEPALAVDFDGDGVNEVVQRNNEGDYVVLKPPARGATEAKVIGRIKGALAPPTFADLDGDGKVEVIAVRLGDSEGPEVKRQPLLEVTRSDGSLVWRRAWPADFVNKYTLDRGGFAITYATVGHFTGKNPLDVAVSFTGEKIKGNTAVLDGATGKTVWSITSLYPGMYGECWDANPPVVLDYDGDGLDDLVTTCQTVHYAILRGKDGKQLLDKPRDASSQDFGGEKPLFPAAWAVAPLLGAGRAGGPSTGPCAPTLSGPGWRPEGRSHSGSPHDAREGPPRAGSRGDGQPEIAVFASQAAVGVARLNGEALWFLNLLVVNRVPSPGCWADVDGDGKVEAAFIFTDGWLRVYDGMTGAVRWEENLGATGSLVAADVDGDGADEILFSSEKGALVCLGDKARANGSHIQWAKEFPGVPAQAIFADINGDPSGSRGDPSGSQRDGLGEILVPTSDGYLNCLSAAGG